MFSPEYGLRRTLTDALEDELYHISNKFYPDEDLTLSSTTLASQHSSPTFSTPTKDGIAASAIAHTTTSAPTAAPVPIPTSNDTLAAEPWQGLDLTRALDDLERQFGCSNHQFSRRQQHIEHEFATYVTGYPTNAERHTVRGFVNLLGRSQYLQQVFLYGNGYD